MAQYADAKKRYPDALVFFRMGDFYEMFHDDAKLASKELGLTLTARDKERKIPMAGVPVKAADGYLQRLLARGHKVAICEQMSDPKTTKGLLEREVVRVLTPGTLTEDESLDPRESNFLLAIRPAPKRGRKRRAGLAWVDLSTGRFLVAEPEPNALLDELARIQPAEVLLPESEDGMALGAQIAAQQRTLLTYVPPWSAEPDAGARALKEHFQVASLKGFGMDRMTAAQGAAGAVLEYLRDTQLTSLGHVTRIERHDPQGALVLGETTRRRLDLVQRADGSRDLTLVSVLDRTRTAMGGRMLRDWVLAPLTDRAAIERRLDGVEELVKDGFLRRDLRDVLANVRDVERILARVATNRANARDLVSLAQSLEALPPLKSLMDDVYGTTLAELRERVECFEDLGSLLTGALVDDPPTSVTDGGLIREGYDAKLDELRHLSRNAKDWIANYQAQEAERTGISTLKVGFNKVFGYYLEVTHAHKDKVPDDYNRKQTLTNAERYVTPELDEYEKKVLRADEKARDLEYRLFGVLREKTAEHIPGLQSTAAVLAEIDVLAALAEIAAANDYVRPELLEDRTLELRDARHPVVEAALVDGDRFVPNDTELDGDHRIALITGPNMSGKSTYIRQTAVVVLMAQMGSFVPASKARVGICDRLFTRVGAEDDLARGQSTFMVEMSEAAYILNHATSKSLVILDEVGRGTSTFDGIAIAWALTEYLSEVVGARTLFATHYAELTRLSDELSSVKNLNVAVREWGDSIVFLRRIQAGATDRSYGIHVARLAGVPEAVVERARGILKGLEGDRDATVDRITFGDAPAPQAHDTQLGLFMPAPPDPVVEELAQLDVDQMTPVEALQKLDELRKRARRS
ncbi:MAG: DNA mismatch repair protein MutS [Planctomycetota bacterium]|nr:DNA mismatch repair protein MutS [Planctomycetota bacterium]